MRLDEGSKRGQFSSWIRGVCEGFETAVDESGCPPGGSTAAGSDGEFAIVMLMLLLESLECGLSLGWWISFGEEIESKSEVEWHGRIGELVLGWPMVEMRLTICRKSLNGRRKSHRRKNVVLRAMPTRALKSLSVLAIFDSNCCGCIKT